MRGTVRGRYHRVEAGTIVPAQRGAVMHVDDRSFARIRCGCCPDGRSGGGLGAALRALRSGALHERDRPADRRTARMGAGSRGRPGPRSRDAD
jgi:hypothetical protein